MPKAALRAAFVLILAAASVVTLAAAGFGQGSSPAATGTGIYRGRWVSYQIVNGRMMFEGDIALDHVEQKLGTNAGATLS